MSTEFFSDRILDFLSNEDNKEDISDCLEATEDALIADIPDSVLDPGGDGVVPIVERELDGRPAAVSSEFKRANAVKLERLIAKNDNENTKRSTTTWVRRYYKWATERGMPTDLARVLPTDLDAILQQFYAELWKRNGDDYEPESLKVMQTALDRHLRDEGCSHSILKDREFQRSRKVLNGKAVDLQEKGKGKGPMKADPLTREDEAHLWSSGVLGSENPTSLNYTIFTIFSQHFGTRGRQEHHQIRIEDLKFVRAATTGQISHVEWIEGPTKTRQGGLKKRPCQVTQKLMHTGGPPLPCCLL